MMATKETIIQREKEKQVMEEIIGQSQAGPIEKIPNLKKRQRSIYWRQINGEWMETKPLPSDAQGRELYLSKGFRLKPPSTDNATPEGLAIDQEKENLIAENARLRQQLAEKPVNENPGVITPAERMAKARAAKALKQSQSTS